MIDEKYMEDQEEAERTAIEDEVINDDTLFEEIAVSYAFKFGYYVPDVSFMDYAVDYVRKTRTKAHENAWIEDNT